MSRSRDHDYERLTGDKREDGNMSNILLFGDSNTWGLVPGSVTGERYPQNIRWAGILREKYPSHGISEEGLCGRTTVFEDPLKEGRKGIDALKEILKKGTFDAAVIMLGTNDCKTVYGASAREIGGGAAICLDETEKYISPDRVLLVSPVALGENVWKPEKDPEFSKESVKVSRELKKVYGEIAEKRGCAFLAASDLAGPDEADDEHLNEEGHRALAEAVALKLQEMSVIN